MMLTSPLGTALSASRSRLVNGSLATRRVAHLRRHQTNNALNGPIIGNTSRQGGGSVGSHLAAAFGGGVVVLLAGMSLTVFMNHAPRSHFVLFEP